MLHTMKIPALIAITGLVLVATACSQRQWYEGIRASNRQECMRLPVPAQSPCLERSDLSYEEYRRQREESRD